MHRKREEPPMERPRIHVEPNQQIPIPIVDMQVETCSEFLDQTVSRTCSNDGQYCRPLTAHARYASALQEDDVGYMYVRL